jgi:hypothetical protein
VSTVEEFERKMDMLAETNGVAPGRWVLVPRKGERFMGSRDRTRVRMRRRRRQVFSFLVEATALTLLIGFFPPLRMMLVGTVILAVLLLLYMLLLIQLKATEEANARVAQARHVMVRQPRPRAQVFARMHAPAGAIGKRNGHGNGHGIGHGNGHGQANGNGHRSVFDLVGTEDLLESGVRILDDVHVIIRRRGESEPQLQVAQ